MFAPRFIELHCPVCETTFESTSAPASIDDAGAMPFLVHACDRCGYAGFEADFDDDVDLSADVRARVWADLTPAAGATTPASVKCEAAARVAEWRGLDPLFVADFWNRASFCSHGEGDHEAERYYARRAACYLGAAMRGYDLIDRTQRTAVAFWLGDLWSCIGDAALAVAWFERVAFEADDPSSEPFVAAAERRLLAARRDNAK